MTSYKQGDIPLVPFPFIDQSGGKQRPAVALSSQRYNQAHLDIMLAPITSPVSQAADEVMLADWHEAGLLKPSIVKPLISSFDARLVRRQLGTLSQIDLSLVRAAFALIFELPRFHCRCIIDVPRCLCFAGEHEVHPYNHH